MATIGGWPSGKAPGFGPGIQGFESLTPSHINRVCRKVGSIYMFEVVRDSNAGASGAYHPKYASLVVYDITKNQHMLVILF